jgi:hypothetical protein
MSDPQIDVEVDSGIDQIAINYDSPIDIISIDSVDGIDNIVLDIPSDISSIDVNFSQDVDIIVLEEAVPNIQVIEIGTVFSAVSTVNGLSDNVVLTYITTLSYVSPSSGVYVYTVTHNLGYENPIIMVYNTDNETVIVEHDAIDANTIEIRSLSNMNNFKVVVQR